MRDDPAKIAFQDQLQAGHRDTALALYSHYQALRHAGFDKAEALMLTRDLYSDLRYWANGGE